MKNLKSMSLGIVMLSVSQMGYAQWTTSPTVTTSPIYHNTFELYNDGAFHSTLNSNNAAKIDMGFTTQGYVDFTLHTGSGYRQVLYMNGDGYVGLGTGTPAYKLDVTGDVNIPSGQAYRLGGVPFLSGGSGVSNVFVGARAGLTGAGHYCTFVGENAGANNTYYGIKNTFLGFNSGLFNTDGNNNTFIGGDAGYFNLVGSQNVFVGMRSGYNMSSGYENTFVGNEAGYSNTDGYANTFVGYHSGFNSLTTFSELYGNTFVGHNSGYSNTYGGGNVFMGKDAGYSNSFAELNVYVGYEAGKSIETGGQNVILGGFAAIGAANGISGNVMIGASSGSNSNGLNNVFVGHSSRSAGSSNTILGSSAYGPGAGTGSVDGIVLLGSGSTITRASSSDNVNGAMAIGYNATSSGLDNSTAIGSSASVTTANTMALGGVAGSGKEVGVVIGYNAIGGAFALDVNGDARGTANWIVSDKRFKEEIKEMKGAMEKIRKLNPVTYLLKQNAFMERKGGKAQMNFSKTAQVGFIAQELEEVYPELVSTDDNGYKAVNYAQMVSVLTQGIKEQDQELREVKEENFQIKQQNTQLLSAIDELTARLDALEQRSTDGSLTSVVETKAQTGKLEQNQPNPFTDNTVIKYFVPQTAKVATIIIRSDKAQEVMKFSLEHKGNGNIIVSANTLTAGGYNCELYVDGELADSKKMLLVK